MRNVSQLLPLTNFDVIHNVVVDDVFLVAVDTCSMTHLRT